MGKISSEGISPLPSPEHPHARGEKARAILARVSIIGTTPHAWEKESISNNIHNNFEINSKYYY